MREKIAIEVAPQNYSVLTCQLVHGLADGIVKTVGELYHRSIDVAVDLQPIASDFANRGVTLFPINPAC